MDYKSEFISLISLYPDDIDTYLDEPIDVKELIRIAEKRIGRGFPNSYKDFVQKFGYAVIFGEEIFSLYPEYHVDWGDGNSNVAYPSDIVYNNINNKKKRGVDENLIRISHTGFDDKLFFDYHFFHGETGECDIFVLWPGSPPVLYAKDFYEFLCKRVYEYTRQGNSQKNMRPRNSPDKQAATPIKEKLRSILPLLEVSESWRQERMHNHRHRTELFQTRIPLDAEEQE